MIACKRGDQRDLPSMEMDTTHSDYTSGNPQCRDIIRSPKHTRRFFHVIRETDESRARRMMQQGPGGSMASRRFTPQMFSNWIVASSIARLNTAYRYLTPIIDDIISRATSYTHNEFRQILATSQPICTISYTQYIRAYQASEIITQVGRELRSLSDLNNPYQVDFCINNMATIKQEDLLENIERMADRIFIDRDLMKQLVNLHELITETIQKLKINLEQVNNESIPQELQDTYRRSSDNLLDPQFVHDVEIDREKVRANIAENFIVIGEPKDKGCHCEDGPPKRREKKTHNADYPDMKQSTVLQVESDGQPLQLTRGKKRSKAETKNKFVSATRTPRSTKNDSLTQTGESSDALKFNKALMKRRIARIGQRYSEQLSRSSRQFEDLSSRNTEFTVTASHHYEPKCNEGVVKACAVLPEETEPLSAEEDDMKAAEELMAPYIDIDEEALVVAESDSNAGASTTGLVPDEPTSRVHQVDKPPLANITSTSSPRSIASAEKCTEGCSSKGGMPCSDLLGILRSMMAKMADQLFYLKEKDIVNLEGKEYKLCENPELDKEYQTMQEAMYCFEALEDFGQMLMQMNFAETEATFPDVDVGCCYRQYPHVHTDVHGIPIVVKVSETLLSLLQTGYPYIAGQKPAKNDNHKETQGTQLSRPGSVKNCQCKPPTFKNLLKDKWAHTKMFSTRNEVANRNKVVMMAMDQDIDDLVFGMQADSLLVESAYSSRQPDVYQIMEMGDSNTSLPYVVNRTSLPNITVCPPMTISPHTLCRQVRNINVEHPKPRIERELQNIGFDNLIRASIPAKCCLPKALNRVDAEDEPLHASLNSLPLTTSDLQLIMDVVDEETYNITSACNYNPLPNNYCYYCLTLARYANFQESERRPRVYLVYYFEIFKKDADAEQPVPVESSRRPRSRHTRHHRKLKHARHEHSSTAEDSDHLPSRSLLSEFFRKFIFAAPVADTSTEHNTETHGHGRARKKGRRKSNKDKPHKNRGRKSREHSKSIDREPTIRERGKDQGKETKKPRKKWKNQRLQANSQELDRYLSKGELSERLETAQAVSMDGPFQFNRISSFMKNYTVSTMTSLPNPYKEQSEKLKCKEPDGESQGVKCTRKHPITKDTDVSNKQSHVKLPDKKKTFWPPEVHKSTINLNVPQETHSDMDKLTNAKGGRREGKSEMHKTIKETTSIHNLGTIYESDEKVLNKDSKQHDSCETFYDFVRTSDLSKSFIDNEQVDMLERNKVEPEEFWSMYFKSRREAYRTPSPPKSSSATSIIDTETSRTDNVTLSIPRDPELVKKPTSAQIPSRIPRRIATAPCARSTSEYCFARPESTPAQQRHQKPSPSFFGSATLPPVLKPQAALSQSVISQMASLSHADEGSQSREESSLHSLKVLASKNGPGYITILHPVCGCPEVSIFIPCYCGTKGHKYAATTSKHIARLSANTSGRHILLPASCRIPRLKATSAWKVQKPSKIS